MNQPILKEVKFSAASYLVAPICLQRAFLCRKSIPTRLNPVSGTPILTWNPTFHASCTDLGSEKVLLASRKAKNQSIAQRGRGLTKCWCCRGCLSRPLLLDSDILLGRRSYFEWAAQAPQRAAGPAPDHGATSYFATI